MNIINFTPYQQVISNAIGTCTTTDQLHCCWHMIGNMDDTFKHSIPIKARQDAKRNLVEAYLTKEELLSKQ